MMNVVKIDKVTLNIGIGAPGEKLENAKALLEKITGARPVFTKAHNRNPTFKIRKGDDIGAKVTIRKAKALELLKKCLDVIDYSLSERSFDSTGNVCFGVKEYIDLPGVKYDPKIGMMGFDVCVTLAKPGYRIQRRRIGFARFPVKRRVSKKEAIEFMKSLGMSLKEEVAQ